MGLPKKKKIALSESLLLNFWHQNVLIFLTYKHLRVDSAKSFKLVQKKKEEMEKWSRLHLLFSELNRFACDPRPGVNEHRATGNIGSTVFSHNWVSLSNELGP